RSDIVCWFTPVITCYRDSKASLHHSTLYGLKGGRNRASLFRAKATNDGQRKRGHGDRSFLVLCCSTGGDSASPTDAAAAAAAAAIFWA
ncbi:hypothetical protein B296_00052999, partial [Ensete ventricosum]